MSAHCAKYQSNENQLKLLSTMQETKHKSVCNLHHVQIIETEASIRCGLALGTVYELAVELSQIVLQQDNKVLFVWPFKHVRRYGYTSNSFSIEAGSKCATGEGLFIFRCQQAIQLYNQAIASVAKIKQLKSRQLAQRNSKSALGPVEHTPIEMPAVATFQGLRHSTDMSLFPPNNTPGPRRGSDTFVPHYVRNNCEYAQVMKRPCNDQGGVALLASVSTDGFESNFEPQIVHPRFAAGQLSVD